MNLAWRLFLLANGLINSTLVRRLLLPVCWIVALGIGAVSERRLAAVLRLFGRIRTRQERGRANLFGEASADDIPSIWLSTLTRAYDRNTTLRRARWLRHLLIAVLWRGARRHVVESRLRDQPNFVPNLSAVFLGTSTSCNLACHGCYTVATRRDGEPCEDPDVHAARVLDAVSQIRALNAFYVVWIGPGEPLLSSRDRELFIRAARRFPDLTFLVFTNGTTLSRTDCATVATLDNAVFMLSIDGPADVHDGRRGRGQYSRTMVTARLLREFEVPFVVVSTVFADTVDEVVSHEFARVLQQEGALFCMLTPYRSPIGSLPTVAKPQRPDLDHLRRRIAFVEGSASLPFIDVDHLESRNGCRTERGSVVYIAPDLGVYPCVPRACEPPFGRLTGTHKDELRDILRQPAFTSLRAKGCRTSSCAARRYRPSVVSRVGLDSLTWPPSEVHDEPVVADRL
jgi:MoaA/NifB/PqqE/SkfB family radical SAM enzyme